MNIYSYWCAVGLVLVTTCLRAESPPTTGVSGLPQGIHGRVIKMVGDFTMDPPTGERVPEQVPVHIFRGRVKPIDKPDPKHPALVKILHPDKEGRFDIDLPPGDYTVVAEIKGALYLNSWMEDGSWAVVTVKAGKWTDFVLEDVLEATF